MFTQRAQHLKCQKLTPRARRAEPPTAEKKAELGLWPNIPLHRGWMSEFAHQENQWGWTSEPEADPHRYHPGDRISQQEATNSSCLGYGELCLQDSVLEI